MTPLQGFYSTAAVVLLSLYPTWAAAEGTSEEDPEMDALLDMTLDELVNLTITTASLDAVTPRNAPSNVIIVTRQMIEQRGYRTLVDVCQDLPGFDFLNYNDGGGEYTTFSRVRGIGGNGNPNILIMVDGVPQNFVNFNWSTLWRYENLLHDLDRIEIIQGPGSALYGAQAFSGVIHFITRKDFEGASVALDYGWQDNAVDLKAAVGHDFGLGHGSLALRYYHTDGDFGLDRPDPGGYFHDNVAPTVLTQHYDFTGAYQTDYPSPNSNAGEPIPDGFANWNDSLSIRGAFRTRHLDVGGYFYDTQYGSGAYVSGLEYYLTHPDHKAHMRGWHLFANSSVVLYEPDAPTKFLDRLTLDSSLVYRTTAELPDSGVRYTYRFDGMTKRWSTYGAQAYLEERLRMDFLRQHNAILGAKVSLSRKIPYVNTLDSDGDTPASSSSTDYSWDLAAAGEGMYQHKDYGIDDVAEVATYLQLNDDWTRWLKSSAGVRFDMSSEYGAIVNPRATVILDPSPFIGAKFIFGSAFRQPSTWELSSFEYGNEDVVPEKVYTFELETNHKLGKGVNIRLNAFYSLLRDLIELADDPDPTPGTVAGQWYQNVGEYSIRGLSAAADVYAFQNRGALGTLSLHANYCLIQGSAEGGLFDSFEDVDRIAEHKVNGAVNWAVLNGYLNLNFRVNVVGPRKAPETNLWLQQEEGGYAPAYVKGNLVVTVKRLFRERFELQLTVSNLWNTQYYGVARGAGANLKSEFHPANNPNPAGFIAPYHPQPGRSFMVGAKVTF